MRARIFTIKIGNVTATVQLYNKTESEPTKLIYTIIKDNSFKRIATWYRRDSDQKMVNKIEVTIEKKPNETHVTNRVYSVVKK